MNKLINLFGSAAEIARIGGVHRTAVGRWKANDWSISLEVQIAILREAQNRGFDLESVAAALGVDRCRRCGTPSSEAIEAILSGGSGACGAGG